MDEAALRRELHRAKLHLGRVDTAVPELCAARLPPWRLCLLISTCIRRRVTRSSCSKASRLGPAAGGVLFR